MHSCNWMTGHFQLLIFSVPPVLIRPPMSIRVTEGDSASFECKVTGTPFPVTKVSWTFDGNPIEVSLISTSTIHFLLRAKVRLNSRIWLNIFIWPCNILFPKKFKKSKLVFYLSSYKCLLFHWQMFCFENWYILFIIKLDLAKQSPSWNGRCDWNTSSISCFSDGRRQLRLHSQHNGASGYDVKQRTSLRRK